MKLKSIYAADEICIFLYEVEMPLVNINILNILHVIIGTVYKTIQNVVAIETHCPIQHIHLKMYRFQVKLI